MLYTAPMRTAALALVTLASLTSVASAGTYIGLGIGSESSGDAEDSYGTDIGSMSGYERSGRLMVGTRISKLSVEGQASRFDTTLSTSPYDATQVALALKLSIPLGNNFEFFGKGGLHRTWLSSVNGGEVMDAAGSGLLLGGGFEYRLSLGVTAASIFVDYQRSSATFNSEYPMEWNGVMSMWTLGATVSL